MLETLTSKNGYTNLARCELKKMTLAMSTNSDYMEARHWYTRDVNPVNHSLLRSVLRAIQFLLDYDEVRIKSQPKEEISRSAVYAKYTSLQSMEY